MDAVAEHAGFFAAHGIWCVSDDGPLIPMLAFERANGKREMIRFVLDKLEAGLPEILAAPADAWAGIVVRPVSGARLDLAAS